MDVGPASDATTETVSGLKNCENSPENCEVRIDEREPIRSDSST
jgi:hypothetical protein